MSAVLMTRWSQSTRSRVPTRSLSSSITPPEVHPVDALGDGASVRPSGSSSPRSEILSVADEFQLVQRTASRPVTRSCG